MRSEALKRIVLAGFSAALLGVIGCGGEGGPPRASVKGTVTHNGSPVPGGSVTFAPIAGGQAEVGKPATGAVQPDGTFTLGTYSPGDGAVIGKHPVLYSPPSEEAVDAPEGGHAEAPPPSPYAGLVPQAAEVEVTSDDNNITIELVKPGGGS